MIRTQLHTQGLSPERANTLLFLIEAGVLQTVDRDRLETLIRDHIASDTGEGVPPLPRQ